MIQQENLYKILKLSHIVNGLIVEVFGGMRQLGYTGSSIFYNIFVFIEFYGMRLFTLQQIITNFSVSESTFSTFLAQIWEHYLSDLSTNLSDAAFRCHCHGWH